MEINDSKKDILNEDNDLLSELGFFKLLFSDEILDLLSEATNEYYRKTLIENYGQDYKKLILSKESTSSYEYYYVTKGISKEDILAYIGVRIYMAIHKLPAIKDYWRAGLYQTQIKKVMSSKYFCLLGQALHFPEKEKKLEKESFEESENSEYYTKVDPRHKIKLYLEKIAKNFQKYYELGRNITIDESLLQFKGRNSMKFYIPMKPHKWGFKIHLLCDSDTSYLYNLILDPGKSGKDFLCYKESPSVSESIVLRLLSCINDKKQRNIFCDGWYSSISLMKKLSNMGYLVTTVLRSNSKEIPTKLKLKGYDKAYDDEILIQKYEGKKTILFATNYDIDKEKLRNIYNIKNRGVDTFDHYLEISTIQRRSLKWYKKIILFGIDASIINSKIICELKTGRSYTINEFKQKLIQQIFRVYQEYNFKKYDEDIYEKSDIRSRFRLHNIYCAKSYKKKCEKCHQETRYFCFECKIGLHPECFIIYHDKKIFNT